MKLPKCNRVFKIQKKIVDFFPDGSDERQFCSPGFNLPIGLVMRKMFADFKEYHNSLDDPNFINFKTILESLNIYLQIILTLENNFYPIAEFSLEHLNYQELKILIYILR